MTERATVNGSAPPGPRGGVVQVTGELIATRRVGAYQHLTFVAPGVAELARPGQFVALAVGGDTSANLLRRCFSIHKVSPSAPTAAPSTSSSRPMGPARRGSPGSRCTTRSTSSARSASRSRCRTSRCRACWSGRLRECPVVLAGRAARRQGVPRRDGARRGERGPPVRRRRGAPRGRGLTVTTDDGSAGTRGWVSDVLPPVIRLSQAGVVYGCGPMGCCARSPRSPPPQGVVAQVLSRSRWPAASGCA